MKPAFLIAVTVTVLAGCSCIACIDEGLTVDTKGFVELRVPDVRVPRSVLYRQWWREIEECSGKSANFDRVRWFWHPTEDHPVQWDDGSRRSAAANWLHQILRVGRTSASDSRIVQHEMLHLVLRQSGHPREYFNDRCAALRLDLGANR